MRNVNERREARPSEADGPVRSVESAERIMRLLRSKRSFSELKDQKGECVTPCDEQLCSRRPSKGRTRRDDGREVFNSKYLHQSNGMSENAVKRVETPVTTSDCVLPEWSGCKVDSENIALSWTVGCAVHVLSQSEKHDHNVLVRLRTRESRVELTQTSETVNPKDVGDEMAKLDLSKTTETSPGRTDEDGERLPQRRTARKQWQQKPQMCPGIQEN